MQGALRQVVQGESGAASWLNQITRKAIEHRHAAELLTARNLAEIDNWPTVPNSVMVGEIRTWWSSQRRGFTARVHGLYNSIGSGLMKPLQYVAHRLHWEAAEPWQEYRQKEWSAAVTAVEKVFDKLTFLSQLGNDLLKPRLQAILSGVSREQLLQTLRESHERVDLPQELAQLVASELAQFREESPHYYELFQKLDVVAAAVRPATSVVLFMTGFGPLSHAVAPAVTDTALQSVLHVAGDFAGGTMAAAVGDSVLSTGASNSAGYLEARFRRLHATFTARRAAWLADLLKTHVLGSLPEELHQTASLMEDDRLVSIRTLLTELSSVIAP